MKLTTRTLAAFAAIVMMVSGAFAQVPLIRPAGADAPKGAPPVQQADHTKEYQEMAAKYAAAKAEAAALQKELDRLNREKPLYTLPPTVRATETTRRCNMVKIIKVKQGMANGVRRRFVNLYNAVNAIQMHQVDQDKIIDRSKNKIDVLEKWALKQDPHFEAYSVKSKDDAPSTDTKTDDTTSTDTKADVKKDDTTSTDTKTDDTTTKTDDTTPSDTKADVKKDDTTSTDTKTDDTTSSDTKTGEKKDDTTTTDDTSKDIKSSDTTPSDTKADVKKDDTTSTDTKTDDTTKDDAAAAVRPWWDVWYVYIIGAAIVVAIVWGLIALLKKILRR